MLGNLIKTLSEASGPDNTTGHDFPDLDDIQLMKLFLAQGPVSLDYLRGVANLAIPKETYQKACEELGRS